MLMNVVALAPVIIHRGQKLMKNAINILIDQEKLGRQYTLKNRII